MPLALLLLIATLCPASAPASAAAPPPAQASRRAAAGCEVEGVKFKCPRGFKAVALAEEERARFFVRKEEDLGLFVAVIGEQEDGRAFAEGLVPVLLRKLLPAEKDAFELAGVSLPARVSGREVGGGAAAAFNGKVLVLVKFRHLKLEGKRVFVGYLAEFLRGREAAAAFEGGGDGESMPGCAAVVEVVYSLTGEQPAGDELPCSILVPAPGN